MTIIDGIVDSACVQMSTSVPVEEPLLLGHCAVKELTRSFYS